MTKPQRASEVPPPGRAWWLSLNWADLLHLAIAALLVYKQRLALQRLGIVPGPGNMLASIGAVLFLTAWVRRASGRWQAALWLVLDALVTLLLYADAIYFRQFGDLVSIAAIRQAHQLTTVGDSVVALMRWGDLRLFVDLPILAALLLVPKSLGRRWFTPIGWPSVMGVAMSGVVLVTGVAVGDPLLSQKYFGHSMVSSRLGLLSYHAFDVGQYGGRVWARMAPQTEAVAEVRGWFADKRRDEGLVTAGGQNPSNLLGVAKGKNLITIQLESFQSFPIGMEIGGQEITPNLNRLLKESLSFPEFYHQTGQGVTSDADLLGNCSLFPTRTGAVYYDYGGNRFRCLPTLLREHGYKAVAMQGMPADFWNLAAVYPRVGFEQYFSIRDYLFDEQIGIGLSDESFFRQSIEKLKGLPEPYYAFLVTLTSHGPFNFDNLPRTLNLGELEGTHAASYLHAVHYTDMAVGKFVDQLKAEGILDRAVLAVYGDHAGIFPHDNGMKELLGLPPDDLVGWTQVEKRVPFMVRLPGGANAGQYPETAGQVDIAPTVAGLLGIPTDKVLFMGRDLLATSGGIVPFYRGSAVDNTYLYVSADDGGGASACYELQSGGKTDLERCAPLRDRTSRQLEISRILVERDLIPAVLEKND